MESDLAKKLQALKTLLKQQKGILVAFSGGTDSSFLLAMTRQVLGKNDVLGVTAISASFPQDEKGDAVKFARSIDARHEFVQTNEMQNVQYTSNSSNRCFFCKTELFQVLRPIATQEKLKIADGFNVSDRSDWRPGYQAAQKWGILHPLDETGFKKEDIREASRILNLSTWNKPASPCLSSRIPYGRPVTEKTLRQIEQAEKMLKNRGFRIVRVRHFGRRADVEVGAEEVSRLLETRVKREVQRELKSLGYEEVVVDPRGYQSGRLNQSMGL